MSENSVDLSGKFSPEEWTLIESAPLLAGLSVMLSDLRSGLFGTIKESFAPSQAILEAGTGASNPIVASVAASIKELGEKRQKLQLPLSVAGKKPEEVKAEVAAQLAKIPAILEGKVPPDQAEGYKKWLLGIAGKVADAATESGFLGFGGERVRAAETAAIHELAFITRRERLAFFQVGLKMILSIANCLKSSCELILSNFAPIGRSPLHNVNSNNTAGIARELAEFSDQDRVQTDFDLKQYFPLAVLFFDDVGMKSDIALSFLSRRPTLY